MSTPCACSSIRGTLAGVVGRQVWRVAGMRQTAPPWPSRLPSLGVEGHRSQARQAHSVPSPLAPPFQGFYEMREAG